MIVPVVANVIAPPPVALASRIAWRSVPGPASAVEVTLNVLAETAEEMRAQAHTSKPLDLGRKVVAFI